MNARDTAINMYSQLIFPELSGSDKQIAWAENIRAEKISTPMLEGVVVSLATQFDGVDLDYRLGEFAARTNKYLQTHTDSRYWIDNKSRARSEVRMMIIRGE